MASLDNREAYNTHMKSIKEILQNRNAKKFEMELGTLSNKELLNVLNDLNKLQANINENRLNIKFQLALRNSRYFVKALY